MFHTKVQYTIEYCSNLKVLQIRIAPNPFDANQIFLYVICSLSFLFVIISCMTTLIALYSDIEVNDEKIDPVRSNSMLWYRLVNSILGSDKEMRYTHSGGLVSFHPL